MFFTAKISPVSTFVSSYEEKLINKEEIENKAQEFEIYVSNVERDYVFGWILAGIYSVSELARLLVLKGGNGFRKAYFPFARFSFW